VKTLTLNHPEITRQSILAQANTICGAWSGIRLAALLLWLAGWKSPAIAELIGVSRCSVCKWIDAANTHGLRSVERRPAPGRKPRLSVAVKQQLDLVLQSPPSELGLDGTRWDGVSVVEYLRRFHKIDIKVRAAQRYVQQLVHTSRTPVKRYLRARQKGAAKFRQTV
jgi:transposase